MPTATRPLPALYNPAYGGGDDFADPRFHASIACLQIKGIAKYHVSPAQSLYERGYIACKRCWQSEGYEG